MSGRPYRVFGYKGKQVRDNIHSFDLVEAFAQFVRAPRVAEVYNLGGGRECNCSMLEAIDLCEEISGRKLSWEYVPENRIGDHIWWISDLRKFRGALPGLAVALRSARNPRADSRRPGSLGEVKLSLTTQYSFAFLVAARGQNLIGDGPDRNRHRDPVKREKEKSKSGGEGRNQERHPDGKGVPTNINRSPMIR